MNAPRSIPGLHALQRRADNQRFAEIEADLMPTLTALKLDTARSTYCGSKGNLTAFIADIEVSARKKEPALLLANKTNPIERHVYVPLGALWALIDPKGFDEIAQQREAINAMAERLFGFVTQQDTFRVLDAIYDFAEDLKNAKPPTWMTHGQWLQALAEDDMIFMHNGRAMNA